MIGSIAAITVFLGFLFFAVQLLFNLYAASVVTANGTDAARDVAAHEADHGGRGLAEAESRAEDDARRRLGRYGGRVRFDWSGTDEDTVRLRLRTSGPHLLFVPMGSLPFTDLDRTVVVRVERFR